MRTWARPKISGWQNWMRTFVYSQGEAHGWTEVKNFLPGTILSAEESQAATIYKWSTHQGRVEQSRSSVNKNGSLLYGRFFISRRAKRILHL